MFHILVRMYKRFQKMALEDEKSIDFVFTNEAVYALKNILNLNSFSPNELKK